MKYLFSKNTIHGIGCIATQDINEGEIVGEEPYFLFTKNITELKDYFWADPEGNYLLINGLGCYCNHSEYNNVKPLINTTKPLITFIAVRDIQKGEELFGNYGQTYFKHRNMTIIKNNKANIQKKTYVKNIKKNISNRPSFIMGKMF